METLFKDPQTLLYALGGGLVPALFWLWFWLKEEDSDQPEPIGLIILSFIAGGIIVFIAVWMEKYSLKFITDKNVQVVIWAAIEELLKLLAVAVLVFGTNVIDEPIDYPVYFITCALGFAAFENILYLLKIFEINGSIVSMLTGNLRFLGSTLLHAIASGMIGCALGLSFYINRFKKFYLFIGIILAIVLHSAFNFFIMKGSGENFIPVFGFLWVIAIINILIFEKLKRMGQFIKTA